MANDPKLKVEITSETSGFVKGAKEVRQNLKDLDKVGNSTLESIGNLFGVNVGKVQQMSSALAGLGQKLQKTGSSGSEAFGKMLSSISGVSTAIAGLGIGAAVTAFKLLNDEASAFKNTIDGANLAMSTAAYTETYAQVMHDMNTATGKSFAETEANAKKTLSRMASFAKSLGVSVIADMFDGDGFHPGQDYRNVQNQSYLAYDNAEKAASIANDIFEIQQKQSANLVTISALEAEIAKYRLISADESESLQTRLEANEKIQELINQKTGIQVKEQRDLADAYIKMNGLASSSVEAINRQHQAEAAVNQLESGRYTELKRIEAEHRKLVDALKEQAAEEKKIASLRSSYLMSTNIAASVDTSKIADALATTDISMEITPTINTEEAQQTLIDFANLVNGSCEQIATSIGTLLGDVLSGNASAWKEFSASAVNAFADMAIAVGKMAVETGTATLGIKAALESLNGYAAIAAGAALIALGAAVKQGMSNIANGNYSASTSGYIANGSYSRTSPSDYASKAIEIELTGEFKASGNALTVALGKENIRKSHTS